LNATIDWLLASDEPWTRYRTLVDLLDRPSDDADVLAARDAMLADERVQGLIAAGSEWGERPLKRHNDASHPLYALSTLADFGLAADDPGMGIWVDAVMAHQAEEGAFQTVVNIAKAFGGTGEDQWTWIACDTPTLLYSLTALGMGDDPRVTCAAAHIASLVDDDGWRCRAATEVGKFRGPGRKADPCPIVNVYAVKALSLHPQWADSPAVRAGAEMLLWHWEHQGERKLYMFGIGTDYRKLKYPYVWYDILHVGEVLSRCPWVLDDPRTQQILDEITRQADNAGRYTASSMYRAWKGWSFANKKEPSPWLTFLVMRIAKRFGQDLG